MAKVPPQRNEHPLHATGQLSALPALAPPLPGGVSVGRFVLDRVLHEGAQGFVYLAHDADGATWALKEYCPRALAVRMDDGSMRARQAGEAISISVAREAFRDEAAALARLATPGLVRVTETLTAFHTLFRVMPLLAGTPLTEWVRSRDLPPSVRELRAFIQGLLEPLAAVHAAGLLHGCVAPEQMLVAGTRHEPTVVLLGFANVARELGSAPEEPWAAPELLRPDRQARVTTAADLYSAAACAWYAATGEAPPTASRRADGYFWSAREGLDALVDEPGETPASRAALVQAIESALAIAPEARPQRVADMQRLLAGDAQVRLISSQPAPLWVGEAPDREEQRLSAPVLTAEPPAPVGTVTGRREAAETAVAAGTKTVVPERAMAPAAEPATVAPRRRFGPIGMVLMVLAGLAIGAWWWVGHGSTPTSVVGVTSLPALTPQGAVEAAPSATIARATLGAASAPSGASPLASLPDASAAPLPPAVAAASVEPAAPASSPAVVRAPPTSSTNAPRVVAKAGGAPARLCAGKTQFAEVYCLQQQCSKATLRAHPQCIAARRAGDVR